MIGCGVYRKNNGPVQRSIFFLVITGLVLLVWLMAVTKCEEVNASNFVPLYEGLSSDIFLDVALG